MIDLSRARRKPYAHQVYGTEWLVDLMRPEEERTIPGALLLADDMRLGKTKQCIDAAQILLEQRKVNQVIVVAPAPVKDVWYDPEFGELAKHLWEGFPSVIYEYHVRSHNWRHDVEEENQPRLDWIITNYEYIRYGVENRGSGRWGGPHLDPLLDVCGKQTVLILDESTAVKNRKALQTRACLALRKRCGRVWLLNGMPVSHSPEDMDSQSFMMDRRILNCRSVTAFRCQYAVMGGYVATTKSGFPVKTQVISWKNLEDMQRRLAPYVLRRIRSECLDLPPQLEPVTLTATLTDKTWKIYKELRDEFVAWLDEQTVAVAAQAAVRAMRLAQVTSGFLGGLQIENTCPVCKGSGDSCSECGGFPVIQTTSDPPKEIGCEKLNVLLNWIKQRLDEDSEMRMLVWCRFRPELFRALKEISQISPLNVKAVYGAQKKPERREGLLLMHPDTKYSGPSVLIGTQGTGSVGLNMAGAHEVVYLSNDYSLYKRKQSEDRPHGPGQTQPISYHDIIAVGPKGQRTIDHAVIKALHARENLATWTMQAWVKALKEE